MSQAIVVSVDAISRRTLVVTTDNELDPEVDTNILNAAEWSVTLLSGLGQRPVVLDVVVTGSHEATLTVYPQVTPGARYRVSAPTVTTPPTEGKFGADPDVVVSTTLVEPYRDEAATRRLPIDRLLDVAGRELQREAGVGASKLYRAWTPGDLRLVLVSTLPFRPSGSVFVGPMRFRYATKTSGSLEGVEPEHVTTEPLGVGTVVMVDESGLLADDGPAAPIPPPDDAPPDWFRGTSYLDF
jgi:hypothetical protein